MLTRRRSTTREFIAKKREMFLVQMSLDTKREEIRKLEEKAQQKEQALAQSERMLEEDAMRFDAFLKENDKKAHEAIKKAEEETKRKQEKTHEIKRLQQQIQLLTSEMTKHKEALEDCMRYKEFLDMLTPPEWLEQQRQTEAQLEPKEELRMYFQRPQQLLEIFTALEEQNLFLIQNSQQMEATLDELRQSFKESKEQMEEKSLALQRQLEELQVP